VTAPPYGGALDTQLADAQLTWQAPSVVAAVVRDGEVTWSGAVGAAQVGTVARLLLSGDAYTRDPRTFTELA
jgi:hypothetical protein